MVPQLLGTPSPPIHILNFSMRRLELILLILLVFAYNNFSGFLIASLSWWLCHSYNYGALVLLAHLKRPRVHMCGRGRERRGEQSALNSLLASVYPPPKNNFCIPFFVCIRCGSQFFPLCTLGRFLLKVGGQQGHLSFVMAYFFSLLAVITRMS